MLQTREGSTSKVCVREGERTAVVLFVIQRSRELPDDGEAEEHQKPLALYHPIRDQRKEKEGMHSFPIE